MIRTYPEYPDWSFDIDEISAGVYQVLAKDMRGYAITRVGIDPESLIDDCKREVATLNRTKNDSG